MFDKFALAGQRSRPLLLVLLVIVVLAGLGIWFYPYPSPPGSGCAGIIKGSNGMAAISLPPGCELRDTVPPDDSACYLESERKRRGLVFEKWIVCDGSSRTSTSGFALERDPHWLPSYVPLTYQFRRTVVVLPYGQVILKGSSVKGAVCLVPEREYISLISGQCNDKFSVWK